MEAAELDYTTGAGSPKPEAVSEPLEWVQVRAKTPGVDGDPFAETRLDTHPPCVRCPHHHHPLTPPQLSASDIALLASAKAAAAEAVAKVAAAAAAKDAAAAAAAAKSAPKPRAREGGASIKMWNAAEVNRGRGEITTPSVLVYGTLPLFNTAGLAAALAAMQAGAAAPPPESGEAAVTPSTTVEMDVWVSPNLCAMLATTPSVSAAVGALAGVKGALATVAAAAGVAESGALTRLVHCVHSATAARAMPVDSLPAMLTLPPSEMVGGYGGAGGEGGKPKRKREDAPRGGGD